ncbi:hypothetical protein EI94DRAFT_1818159 [Lactarius quietus]|nr:hypothetical protein EI94DRAFT_1818159 [Lactarius quietus]
MWASLSRGSVSNVDVDVEVQAIVIVIVDASFVSVCVRARTPPAVVSLAFSNYQRMDSGPFLVFEIQIEAVLIPIRTLFQRSQVFRDYDDISEGSVVKYLNKDAFDIRMITFDKSQSRFPNIAGGHDIRRKDWADCVPSSHHSSTHCLTSTAKLREHPQLVPLNGWNMQSIARHPELQPHPAHSISSIPPRPPRRLLKCKGFALVTLNDPTIISDLLSRFPNRKRTRWASTLSNERWDVLQAEYVEYRESLLRHMAVDTVTTPNTTPNMYSSPDEPERASGPKSRTRRELAATALRTLFSALLANPSALDYIDSTKGLDSCYFRLTAPDHAQALLEAALPKQGDASVQDLELELLEGRQEVYLENVPEKENTWENIPQPYRSIVGIGYMQFIARLPELQLVCPPPPRSSRSRAVLKCKYFAHVAKHVTLNETDEALHPLSRVPSDRDITLAATDSSVDEYGARKAGSRALSEECCDTL